jgi:hypothetical protein
MGRLILIIILLGILYAVSGAVFTIGIIKIILLACGVLIVFCVLLWIAIVIYVAIAAILD